jgi:hypothetical protein
MIQPTVKKPDQGDERESSSWRQDSHLKRQFHSSFDLTSAIFHSQETESSAISCAVATVAIADRHRLLVTVADKATVEASDRVCARGPLARDLAPANAAHGWALFHPGNNFARERHGRGN